MRTLWRLNMHQVEHAVFVLMALSTCIVFHHALAQDRVAKGKVFLVGEANQPPAPPQSETKTAIFLDRTLKSYPLPPDQITILEYLTEKRGRIPLYSGLDGKVQIELGLAGYLGIKCEF